MDTLSRGAEERSSSTPCRASAFPDPRPSKARCSRRRSASGPFHIAYTQASDRVGVLRTVGRQCVRATGRNVCPEIHRDSGGSSPWPPVQASLCLFGSGHRCGSGTPQASPGGRACRVAVPCARRHRLGSGAREDRVLLRRPWKRSILCRSQPVTSFGRPSIGTQGAWGRQTKGALSLVSSFVPRSGMSRVGSAWSGHLPSTGCSRRRHGATAGGLS
jgi:hypothetical protein